MATTTFKHVTMHVKTEGTLRPQEVERRLNKDVAGAASVTQCIVPDARPVTKN